MQKYRTKSLRVGSSRKRSGIVLIEFCIAFLFVLLPLFLALLQYGMIIQAMLAMDNTSREAGRFASVNSLSAPNDTDLKNFIISNAAGMGIQVNNTDIAVTPSPTNRLRYQPLTIDITYDLKSKVFLGTFYGIPFFRSKYTTRVVMVMQ